ncbi:hypothetical protein ACMA5I_13580 [Paracoccaceae bacterium GXU_MW_L88]
MKTIYLFATAVVLAMPASVSFAAMSSAPIVVSQETAHGGGCRKSSPQGQCCHAGSEPYHCH